MLFAPYLIIIQAKLYVREGTILTILTIRKSYFGK